jgi:hypothetical protein
MKKTSLLNVYKNILTPEEHDTCDNILRGFGWIFGFKSDLGDKDHKDNIPFWKLPLDHEPFFTQHMFNMIEQNTEMKFELLEVYCNGQTYAQDGYPHIDNVHGETHTFLYYANKDWNLTWGGQTVLLVDGKKVGIDPYPNRAILFSTDLVHYGEAYNQFCRDLRMTVCYKLREIT